jgi:hypothetical protein
MIGSRRKNPANPTIFRARASGPTSTFGAAPGRLALPAARCYVGRRKYGEFFMKASFMRAFLTRALSLAAAIMFLASPALAQIPKLNLLQDTKPAKTQEEKDAESAQEKAYKDSLKKIPDAKAPSDPWGTVRSTDTPAKSASSGKSKAKTGTATGTGTSAN